MMARIRRHYVMTRLCATVVAYNNIRIKMPNEKVCYESFPGIPKAEVNNDIRVQ